MSMDSRNTSALFKRAEQLKRWEESDTNRHHSGTPKSPSMRRIKFSSGCIFLAACVAGDKDEVSRLLETGADIDTANVDGLTALHQACIDDNLDMVEFLVQNGADVNRKDNEGWTPLHATSSCGFLSIARYLIENGADLAAINSDGELALDLACSDAMEDLIQRHIDAQGIDCDEARQIEEKIMLSDAKRWLRSDSTDCDKPHPKTGATAIHVAAAKGYIKVLGLLLDGRGDFDKQDVDGWTALHAGAYWGQKEAVQMLLNANVDIDIQNYSGQYAIDIAQKDIVPLLDEARKNIKRPKRRPASQIRITDTIENSIETPTKVIRVEVKPIDSKEKEEEIPLSIPTTISRPSTLVPRAEQLIVPKLREQQQSAVPPPVPWRRPRAVSTPIPTADRVQQQQEYAQKLQNGDAPDSYRNQVPEKENQPTEPDVILRRTQSFESDEKFYQKYVELRARIQANSCPILPNTNAKTAVSNYLVQRSASLKDHRTLRKATSNLVLGSTGSTTTGAVTTNVQTTTPTAATSPPTSPTGTPTTTPSAGQIRSITPTNSDNNNINSVTPLEVTVTPVDNRNNNNDSTATTNSINSSSNAINKNHSLFELNRKYIEQAQKTKINNERNKFLSSLNEKRQQQQQETQQQQQEAKAAAPAAAQQAAAKSGTAEKEPSPTEPAAIAKSVASVYATSASNVLPPPVTTTSQSQSPTVTSTNKLSPGNIFKNFFKSFVPPTRDEESETQRKAHAKRVRETRRSTQGVTLDEIKSAEQLVKKKNSSNSDSDPATTTSTTTATPTITTTPSSTTPTSSTSIPINDRVPSVDGSSSGGASSAAEVSNKVPSSATSAAAAATGPRINSDEQVSASFTISVPPSSMAASATVKSNRGDGGDGGGGGGGGGDQRSPDEDGSKISVSYTITTPRLASSATTIKTSSVEATTNAKEKDTTESPTVTAVFSVPGVTAANTTTNNNNPNSNNNNLNQKTESDELTRTKPTIGDSSISSTPASAASITATIRTPSSFSTSKRSLFDIDNANSLTLAEKLRQEANKYAESDKENFAGSKGPITTGNVTATTTTATAPKSEAIASTTSVTSVEGTVLLRKDTSAPSSPLHQHQQHAASAMAERRPSWRLKVDGGSKFKLEDASVPTSISATSPSTTSSTVVTALDSSNNRQQNELNSISMSSLAQRRQNGDSSSLITSRPTSAPELSSSITTPVVSNQQLQQNDASLHLRRPLKASEENKENDKENENRSSAQATQAVIQRRRRPKRRSTGVVHVDMEDIDAERQDSPVDGEEKESGTERGRSRVGSTASEEQKDVESKENGGDYIDYKALYEQAKADNDKLKSAMRKKDEEVISLKAALDRFTTATTKNNSLSELEKRERRAMERKMSEMEEELKLLQKFKTENERLRAENRALTRVVSKLTTSAQNQLHNKQ
ncbi:protein phosphatase 1 regulatory subunit 12A isoform X5 [Topomyia yanbarensis]|uniref:protein phosphatase 1 regulatory subunit 12A isoform X5 n=1 Tax=Topomyia yanbarensis TaxID=2498891 RepID=UPI00273BA285|nr:protein phosphatase 1 regulatory subunit 12A isoform X5 [Topomyia yanbarensis]